MNVKTKKIIRSHRSRVKAAKAAIALLPEKIPVGGREAYVEFYLLEDIERLYQYRLNKTKSKKKETREGLFSQKKLIEKINYLLYMIKKCIEVLDDKISDGGHIEVRKAIHEHKLIVASRSMKNLDVLVSLVEVMLGDIDKDALSLAQEMRRSEEFMDELEDHDANVRRHFDLPEDFDAAMNTVKVDVPEDKKNGNNKPNLN